MVTITIYVEGGRLDGDQSAETISNNALFREGFHRLFSQVLDEESFSLVVQPIGSVTRARNYLRRATYSRDPALVLIDLDGPPSVRQERISRFQGLDTSLVFFMIQEMEAWIISQTEVIEAYAKSRWLLRKHPGEKLEEDQLLACRDPQEIEKPSEKLNNLFRKYFRAVRQRGGERSEKLRNYSKTKDGPVLIGMLNLTHLMEDFSDAAGLVKKVQAFQLQHLER